LTHLVYNTGFHPLARFPGPKLWTSTRLAYVLSLWCGHLARDVRQLYLKYGDIVRIAPDEISIAKPDAWHEVYSNINGREALLKSKLWHGAAPGRPNSISDALDPKDHQRFRCSVEPGLSEKALRKQESIIQSYVDSMISKLDEIISSGGGHEVVNIVQWFGFTTFDLIGDLGFEESFNYLEQMEFHPWISFTFNSMRVATLEISLRYYPGLHWLLSLAIPKSIKRKEQEHFALATDKINRRLNLEMSRPDILSHVKINDNSADGLTIPRVHATSVIFIIAGSETAVTTLSGFTNYLVKNPDKLALLKADIRNMFNDLDDISLLALEDLPYLNAVIQEGFRMCNPV
jgi:cytochrome P450